MIQEVIKLENEIEYKLCIYKEFKDYGPCKYLSSIVRRWHEWLSGCSGGGRGYD